VGESQSRNTTGGDLHSQPVVLYGDPGAGRKVIDMQWIAFPWCEKRVNCLIEG
jgi:hypothetical protein